ncbi:D-alanyl-D-alanine carboxypeptidase [Candidatus Saccharibacteria bacterium]|nr:D-alanyl-D-alanine carboxypeptidase [Candidatus Saccharibacteria bacterium]
MKKTKIIILAVVTAIFVFVIFVGVRMANLDIKIDLVTTYEISEVEKPAIDFATGYGEWTVALNGSVVSKSAETLEIRPTASTAKMILALAVMEKKPFELGSVGETITINQEMYQKYTWYILNNGSNTRVRVGEEISEYDALASALLASSNNMADSLAIWAFGSLDEYKNYATEMLSRIGALNTKLGVDASGYDESTVSTAEDLAKIGDAILKQPVLAEIVGRAEMNVPVAGLIKNTNKLLGTDRIVGIKTGYIGDPSGYCLVSGYKEGSENVTVALLGAPTRQKSFDDSLVIIKQAQEKIKTRELVTENQEVGYFESWWLGKIPITALDKIDGVIVSDPEIYLEMEDFDGNLKIVTKETEYNAKVKSEEFKKEPSLWERFLGVFGWRLI